jgi:hypothetical protein
MQDRVYIKREPSGWAITSDGLADYDSPDDLTIGFLESPEDNGVGLARSEGIEHVLPTPIVRRWAPGATKGSSQDEVVVVARETALRVTLNPAFTQMVAIPRSYQPVTRLSELDGRRLASVWIPH